MIDDIKRILRHSFFFGFGMLSSTVASLFLIPVYTRFLSPAEYGLLEIINVWLAILSICFGLGMWSALFNSIMKHDDMSARKVTAGTAILLLVIPVVISSLIIIFSLGFFLNLLKGINIIYIAILLVLINGTGILIVVPFAMLRAMEQSKKYLALSIYGLVITIALTFILLGFARRNVLGVLEARLLASIGMMFFVSPYLCRNTRLIFNFKEAKELIRFGMPLIPTALGLWVLDLSDRFFLQYFRNLGEVGIYSLGYKYASIVSLPIVAFSLAWPQVLLPITKRPDAKKTIGRIFTYFMLVTTFMALSLSIFSKEVIRMVSAAEFHDAYKIVWYIALGYVFYGGYIFASSGIYISGKSSSLPMAVGIAAILNAGLNYLFIPRFGMAGAACATLISYVIMCLVMWYLSKGFYPISFEFLRLGKIIGAAVIIYLYSSIFLVNNTASTLIIKVLSMPGYVVILFILGFFNREEIGYIREKTQDLISRKEMKK